MVTIGVFATSTPFRSERRDLDFLYLKSKGFKITEAKNLRKKTGHTAGSIKERVDSIHELLRNEKVDILMAYWGGANTNQLLPHLDYELFSKYNKPIIGFSDTSALLLAVNKLSKITTYMGPAGITFDKPEPVDYSFNYFNRLLVKKSKDLLIEDSKEFADDQYFLSKNPSNREKKRSLGRKIFKEGSARGQIVAANLQTLLVLAGTKYFPNLKGKILFLEEDEGENTAMIHRFFTHLSHVVSLDILKGICIGRFSSNCGFSKDDPEEAIYNDVFSNLDIPIIYNLDFGHTDPLFTIPIGGEAIIDTKKNILRIIND